MKVALIRGNERPDPRTPIAEANITGIYPPLGIAYLARALQRAGHDVRIIDAHALNLTPETIAQQVAERGDHVAGVTSTSLNWLRTLRIINAIKARTPTVKIIAGGPHLALFASEAVTFCAIDAAVTGEGELVVPQLLQAYEHDDEPRGIAGIVYRRADGEVVVNPPAAPVADLDSIEFPALELLPLDRYRALTIRRPFFTMITSRGCPYRCGFCSQVYAGGAFRQRSPENVAAEIELYVKLYGAKEIILFDETFTVDEARVLAICDLILRRDLRFRWNIRARADTITALMVQALKRAGCYGIHIGVESGSAAILQRMQKEITLEQVSSAFRLARAAGLETRGYFMLAYPGETRATIEQTIRYSLKLPLDWASYSITVPHPATPIFADAVTFGLIEPDYWLAYTKGEPFGPLPYFTTNEYSSRDLERLLRQAYLRFYLRGSQIVPKLLSWRLWSNLRELMPTLRYLRSR